MPPLAAAAMRSPPSLPPLAQVKPGASVVTKTIIREIVKSPGGIYLINALPDCILNSWIKGIPPVLPECPPATISKSFTGWCVDCRIVRGGTGDPILNGRLEGYPDRYDCLKIIQI